LATGHKQINSNPQTNIYITPAQWATVLVLFFGQFILLHGKKLTYYILIDFIDKIVLGIID